MKEIKNYYFKVGKDLISGIDPDASYKDTHFVYCDFHPNCADIVFTDCRFTDCDGTEYLKQINAKE